MLIDKETKSYLRRIAISLETLAKIESPLEDSEFSMENMIIEDNRLSKLTEEEELSEKDLAIRELVGEQFDREDEEL